MPSTTLPKPDLSVLDRQKIIQTLNREWLYALTPAEYKIVCFVYDRTVSWGKSCERIGLTDFVKGRTGAFKGTGMGRSTVQRAIENLVYLGTLSRKSDGKTKSTYGLNVKWKPEDAAMLPPSRKEKQLKKCVQDEHPYVQNEHPTVFKMTPLYKGTIKDTLKEQERATLALSSQGKGQETPEVKVKSSLSDVMKAAEAKAQQDALTKKSKGRKSLSVNVRQAAWAVSFAEHWPDAPAMPWSPKARGLFKHAVKNNAFSHITPGDFFEWVVDEYGLIRASVFGWMNDAPQSPTPEFVMTHIYKILTAYADRETIRNSMQVEGAVRTRLQQKRRGLTSDQIDQRSIRNRERRTDLDAKEEKIRKEASRLERERKIFERQKKYSSARLSNIEAQRAAKDKPVDTPSGLAPLPVVSFEDE